MGDPCGVGPEVILRALADARLRRSARFVIIGYESVMRAVARRFGLDASYVNVSGVSDRKDVAFLLNLRDLPSRFAMLGKPTPIGGAASIACVDFGVRWALSGMIDALVTAPINKQAIAMAGFRWPGHTELLRELTGAKRAVMMMAGGGLRVALVTTHVAMDDLPWAITRRDVAETLNITHAALKSQWGIAQPRIAVCGLNPHAGEAGRFGREETKAIVPAVKAARAKQIACAGPISGDVVFRQALDGRYDAVIAMYHDQACIPVKLLAFDSGVNVTLGLPIIRTSPDHGTAYDIVRRGCADPGSMLAAIELAIQLARQRKRG
jgi:4-hydroxythreonine-4-phosphate dehydrogenase